MLRHHSRIPCTHELRIFDFQAGDPNYQVVQPDGSIYPGGISLAKLHERFGGNEGQLTGPSSEVYSISLAPWADKDPEKTLFRLIYHSTPLLPVSIDPSLRSQPSSSPKAATTTSTSATATALRTRVLPVDLPSKNFLVAWNSKSDHVLTIRPAPDNNGTTADALLARPEGQSTEIACPLCDGTVLLQETLAGYINRLVSIAESDNSLPVQLLMAHPAEMAETKTSTSDIPIVVERYRRYAATSVNPRTRDEEDDTTSLYIAGRVHEHIIALYPDEGTMHAEELLRLPETHSNTLTCPVCDETLSLHNPLEQYINILMEEAKMYGENENRRIALSISHPTDIPETQTVPTDTPFQVLRHAQDDLVAKRLHDGYFAFVLQPR